jgi:hypothetical protein
MRYRPTCNMVYLWNHVTLASFCARHLSNHWSLVFWCSWRSKSKHMLLNNNWSKRERSSVWLVSHRGCIFWDAQHVEWVVSELWAHNPVTEQNLCLSCRCQCQTVSYLFVSDGCQIRPSVKLLMVVWSLVTVSCMLLAPCVLRLLMKCRWLGLIEGKWFVVLWNCTGASSWLG